MDVGEVDKGRKISIFKRRVDQPVILAVVVVLELKSKFDMDFSIVVVYRL